MAPHCPKDSLYTSLHSTHSPSWPGLYAFLILPLATHSHLHADIVNLKYLWFSRHAWYCCSFLTFPLMFPWPAGSPNYSSSSLSNAIWILSFSFLFSGLLLLFIHTSSTAGVFVCYHYTWTFMPSTDNLELRCGHSALCHWHPFWWIRHLFWLVSAHAIQLLNGFNINFSLLPSSVWQREGAQNYLLILKLGKTKRLSYSWLHSCISPSYSHCVWSHCTEPDGSLQHFQLGWFCTLAKQRTNISQNKLSLTWRKLACLTEASFLTNQYPHNIYFSNSFKTSYCPEIVL